MYVLIILVVIAISTFAYSIYGVLTDKQVTWEQMDWKPTYPFGKNFKSKSYCELRKYR